MSLNIWCAWFIYLSTIVFADVACSIVVLNPFGDARTLGRSTAIGYERTVTALLCNGIKKRIAELNKNITVIVTHTIHDTLQPLQEITTANLLAPDLYLHICCCPAMDQRESVALYACSLDTWDEPLSSTNREWRNYNSVHRCYTDKTGAVARRITDVLTQNSKNKVAISGPHALPCKPLIGIDAPACMVECAILNTFSVDLYAQLLADAIAASI